MVLSGYAANIIKIETGLSAFAGGYSSGRGELAVSYTRAARLGGAYCIALIAELGYKRFKGK
jgi:hypothetical protein